MRLEAASGHTLIEILAPDGAPQTLRRAGQEVVDSAGRRQSDWTLTATGHGTFKLDGRAYPGQIVVRPDGRRGLAVFNVVDFESYVAGVVASELAIWSAPPAELEAQAIAARTFAARELRARAHVDEALELVDGVMDQAYHGIFQPDSAGARAVAQRLTAAVRATRGVVLVRDDIQPGSQPGGQQPRFEQARFHASCGGHTALFSDVFRRQGPGPRARPCAPCSERASNERAQGSPDPQRPLGWSVTLPQEMLARAGRRLGLGGSIQALAPKRLDPSGRWIDAQLIGLEGRVIVVPFDDLRAALGYSRVKSAHLTAARPAFGQEIKSGLQLTGRGRGHGVGLCQEGAGDLARDGWSSAAILRHYYPDARLMRLE